MKALYCEYLTPTLINVVVGLASWINTESLGVYCMLCIVHCAACSVQCEGFRVQFAVWSIGSVKCAWCLLQSAACYMLFEMCGFLCVVGSKADMRVVILERVFKQDPAYRKERESHLIRKFNTFCKGMNQKP